MCFQRLLRESREGGFDFVVGVVVHRHVEVKQEGGLRGRRTFCRFRFPVGIGHGRVCLGVVGLCHRVVVACRGAGGGGWGFLGSVGLFLLAVRGFLVFVVPGFGLVGFVVGGFVVGVFVGLVVGVVFSCVFSVVVGVFFVFVFVFGLFFGVAVRGDGGGVADVGGDEGDWSEGGRGEFGTCRPTAGGGLRVDLHRGRLLLVAVVGWMRLSVKNSVFTVFVRKACRCFFGWRGHFELEDDSL